MSTFIRSTKPGGTFFFTVVTYRRRKILAKSFSRIFLREAISKVRREYPFTIEAWVLLPDHLHCIWTLPEGDRDFSKRWGLIKAGFSQRVKPFLYMDAWMTESKERHRESIVWQRRFWEHQIRNEEDLHKHLDYIHFNPVKHKLVTSPMDWPYSTLHRYVHQGLYPANWGESVAFEPDLSFGE
ncbi:MAG: REP-associated tyrosine transposase [Desulfobaccales bacterium]